MVIEACLVTCMTIAAQRGNVREAALLVGAAAQLQEELGSIRDRFEEGLWKHTVASLRESLGTDAYEEAIRHGRELTLEEAAACALAATGALD